MRLLCCNETKPETAARVLDHVIDIDRPEMESVHVIDIVRSGPETDNVDTEDNKVASSSSLNFLFNKLN